MIGKTFPLLSLKKRKANNNISMSVNMNELNPAVKQLKLLFWFKNVYLYMEISKATNNRGGGMIK